MCLYVFYDGIYRISSMINDQSSSIFNIDRDVIMENILYVVIFLTVNMNDFIIYRPHSIVAKYTIYL